MEILFAFESTHAAIHAEKAALAEGLIVSVMPLPQVIAAGCGICLRIDESIKKEVQELLIHEKIDSQAYYMTKREKGIGFDFSSIIEKPIANALNLAKNDIVSIIGCGGKTSLLFALAEEWKNESVLLSTTTKMYMPTETQADKIFDNTNISELILEKDVCGRTFVYSKINEKGKVLPIDCETLRTLSVKFDLTVLECDGSRALPMKGYADNEPVIPGFTTFSIAILSIKALGLLVSSQTVFQPELFCEQTGAKMNEPIEVNHMIALCRLMNTRMIGRKMLLINQVNDEKQINLGEKIIDQMHDDDKKCWTKIILADVQTKFFYDLTTQ